MGSALILALFAALAGIIYAVWCARWVLRQPEGEACMHEPYLAIREGAHAYLWTPSLRMATW